MTVHELDYSRAISRARIDERTKRERAADFINTGRKLAREARAEEKREAELDAEYGPKVKR